MKPQPPRVFQRPNVFKSLVALGYGVAEQGVVSVDVTRFVREFTEGHRDPEWHLARVAPGHKGIVDAWLSVPMDRRVFVIGSSKDSPEVLRLMAETRARQGEVFFYEACRAAAGALCTSQVVGAFHATAGSVLVADSEAARSSAYVAAETARAAQLRSPYHGFVVTSAADWTAAMERLPASPAASQPSPTGTVQIRGTLMVRAEATASSASPARH